MSLTELTSEIALLSAAELKALQVAIEAELTKKHLAEPATAGDYLGSMRGTATLKAGWDDDEPLEEWNAERDDTPL